MTVLSDGRTVHSPYSDLAYLDPTFGKWEEWFAWYPVKKNYVVEDESIKVYRWIWMRKINRRKVTHGPPLVMLIDTWEYAEMLEILKHGH